MWNDYSISSVCLPLLCPSYTESLRLEQISEGHLIHPLSQSRASFKGSSDCLELRTAFNVSKDGASRFPRLRLYVYPVPPSLWFFFNIVFVQLARYDTVYWYFDADADASHLFSNSSFFSQSSLFTLFPYLSYTCCHFLLFSLDHVFLAPSIHNLRVY